MDELNKILESVFAAVKSKGVESLDKTPGWDTLSESEQETAKTSMEALFIELSESVEDTLKPKVTELFEAQADAHQSEIVELKEKANEYGDFLKGKADEYGDFLKEQAEAYANSKAAEVESELAEKLNEYIEIALAENTAATTSAVANQKAKAYDYLSEQLSFVLGQVGVTVSEDEETAAKLAESIEGQGETEKLQTRLDEVTLELNEMKKTTHLKEAAVKAELSASQSEKLVKLCEHLDIGTERFEKRVAAIVGMVKGGKDESAITEESINESVNEDFNAEDKKTVNSGIGLYRAAAKGLRNTKF